MRSFLGRLFNAAPVPFVPDNRLSVAVRPPSGAEQQMAAMGAVGTLFAIVNRCAEATSQVDWKLFRKETDGRRTYGPHEPVRTEVVRHAALDVWNKPNRFYTRQEFVQTFQQHLDLTGEGWWLTSRVGSIPLELWPVRPDKMEPVPHSTDFLSGYIYHGPNGEKVPLDIDEVVQLRMPNPLDPYRGMGPVQSILVDLEATRASAEWNRNFFRNSAEPGGVIQLDKRLSDSEFQELQYRWNEQHKGTANAHRVAILEGGTYVDRKYSMRDMQFTELRDVGREVIREAFGFPKPMLGTVEDVNRANAEAAEVVFARWLVVPRLERIKQALNNDFLPMFGPTGQNVEFDYCNPVPDDREADAADLTAKANAAAALVAAGWNPDDVLAVVGLAQMAHNGAQMPVQPAGALP